MRIGLLSGQIGLAGGGRSNVVPLAKQLDAAGHEVVMFAVERGRHRMQKDPETGLPIHTLGLGSRLLRHPGLLLRYLQRRQSSRLPYVSASAIADFIARWRFDAVYSFYNFNALPLLMGAPHANTAVAINLIGYGITKDRGGGNDTYWLQREIFRRPLWDVQCAATEEEHGTYERIYRQFGVHADRLARLPHPYDSSHFFFRPGTPRNPAEIRLIYPVAVYPRKNVESLIDVLHTLKTRHALHAKAVVTGRIIDHAYHRSLLERADELGVRSDIEFLGGVAPTSLGERIRASDAVYYPSFQETFGIGVVEALACGVPVVVPDDIPALREFSDLPGVMLSSRSTAHATEQVMEAVAASADPVQRSLVAEGARPYSSEAVAGRLVDLLDLACRRKRDLEAFDWEALYGDQEYVDQLFKPARSSV